jgi:hypothetical protein
MTAPKSFPSPRLAVTLALALVALVVACRKAAPQTRACTSNGACAASEYCAFEPRLCGKGKSPGTCKPRPSACRDPVAPVCGCDGKIHATECEAHAAGIDLDVNGRCRDTVPDWVACGPTLCDAHTRYCEIVLSDVAELPTDFTCKPLPTACLPEGGTARTCACFPRGTRCGSFCGVTETGGLSGFHLTCRL